MEKYFAGLDGGGTGAGVGAWAEGGGGEGKGGPLLETVLR